MGLNADSQRALIYYEAMWLLHAEFNRGHIFISSTVVYHVEEGITRNNYENFNLFLHHLQKKLVSENLTLGTMWLDERSYIICVCVIMHAHESLLLYIFKCAKNQSFKGKLQKQNEFYRFALGADTEHSKIYQN